MPEASAAEIRPEVVPSTKKGKRMKPLVAPTSFMMPISLRRAKTVMRMVLLMTTMLTMASTATRP